MTKANTTMRIVSQIPIVLGYVVGAVFAAVPLWGAVAIARRDAGDEYPFINPFLALLLALYGMAAGIPGILAMLRYWPSPLASRRRRLYGAAAPPWPASWPR